MQIRLRMTRGSGWLDQWAATAAQVEKNAVHQALFAILDGSVFTRYEVLDDADRGREFFVLVREDLVIKASLTWQDTFGLLYIGPPDAAPGWRPAVTRREQRSRLGLASSQPPWVDPDQPPLEA
jgi:Family of unknown function (DUF6235)